MNEKLGFSASSLSFYFMEERDAYIESGSWPGDVSEVSEAVWSMFTGARPKGKVLGANEKGMPCWKDAPAPTPEEKREHDSEKRDSNLTEAESAIQRLSLAKELVGLSDEEEKQLTEWKAFFSACYRIHPQGLADIIWPAPPA